MKFKRGKGFAFTLMLPDSGLGAAQNCAKNGQVVKDQLFLNNIIL